MDERYMRFNEITFEAYIKKAIDRSVLKARLKKAERGKSEQTFSMLSDAVLYTLAAEGTAAERAEMDRRVFEVRGIHIPVYGYELGQALSFLLPKDREIILLYFFLGLSDQQIGRVLGASQTTIQRRRAVALGKLQDILEAMP